MRKQSISMLLQEIDQVISEHGMQAGKQGQRQSYWKLRLDTAKQVRATLAWCRDNEENIRMWAKAKDRDIIDGQDGT